MCAISILRRQGWALVLLIVTSLPAQTTYTWSPVGGSLSWLNSNNWTGNAGHFPGVDANASSSADGASNDIVAISGTIFRIDINFASSANSGVGNDTGANGSLTVGAVDRMAGGSSFTLRNKDFTSGTFTLTGATVNGVANTILANESSVVFSISGLVLALGNATNNVVQTNVAGIQVSNDISGSGQLTKMGSGTLTFDSATSYTGATVINGGTLVANTANALAKTSSITVNSGGTLTINATGSTTNIINDAATMTLNGGTFNTSGRSEHGATNNTSGIGALTLQSNSIINLGGNASGSKIAFANSSGQTWSGTLSIFNWTGNVNGGGADQVFFGGDNSGLTAAELARIQFFTGTGTGAFGLGAMILSDGEIVPIPEPASWIAATLALFALAGIRRRRKRHDQRL